MARVYFAARTRARFDFDSAPTEEAACLLSKDSAGRGRGAVSHYYSFTRLT
jgi:hypothetical protein